MNEMLKLTITKGIKLHPIFPFEQYTQVAQENNSVVSSKVGMEFFHCNHLGVNSGKVKIKELVPKEKTFHLLKEKPNLDSIKFWIRGKVAENIKYLINTRAIEIIIKKHPEKLEEFFEKTNSAKLLNLLRQNPDPDSNKIHKSLNWSARRTNKEIAKLYSMGFIKVTGKRYRKIFLIEPEKTKEKELTPQVKYVLKTSVGSTFNLLEEKPDPESILSWRGKVAKNIEKLVNTGAIEIKIEKHPEKLDSSPKLDNEKIPIFKKDSLFQQKKMGHKICPTKDLEKINRQRLNFISKIITIKENGLPPHLKNKGIFHKNFASVMVD